MISLLYNGLLRGAAGAPLQRLTAWLDGCLTCSSSAQAASATDVCSSRLKKDLPNHEKPLSENRERGYAHAHIKGTDLIQYCVTKNVGAKRRGNEGGETSLFSRENSCINIEDACHI